MAPVLPEVNAIAAICFEAVQQGSLTVSIRNAEGRFQTFELSNKGGRTWQTIVNLIKAVENTVVRKRRAVRAMIAVNSRRSRAIARVANRLPVVRGTRVTSRISDMTTSTKWVTCAVDNR